MDVLRNPRLVRRKIGLSGQYAAVDEYLTGYENLEMIGRLYHLGRERSRARARELLERFDLVDAGDTQTQARRVVERLAHAFLHRARRGHAAVAGVAA